MSADRTRLGDRAARTTALPSGALVRARLLAHPVAVNALVADLLLTFTVVAALASFSVGWISDAGARVVRDAPVDRKVLVLTGDHPTDGDPGPQIQARLADRFQGDVAVTGWATGLGLPGSTDSAPRLAQLAYLSRATELTDMVEGHAPRASASPSGPMEVAIPRTVADTLHWRAGQEVTLTDRAEKGRSVTVRITGIYTVRDPGSWAWVGNPFARESVSRSGMETYGLVLVAQGDFERRLARSGSITALVRPGAESLRADRLATSSAEAAGITQEIREDPYLRRFSATGSLPAVLAEGRAAQLATINALVTPTILLLSVAATGLVLAVSLLVTLRRGEVELLRGRGISAGQFVRLGLVESLVLVVPAAITAGLLGPWLAHTVADLPRAGAEPLTVALATAGAAVAAVTLLLTQTARTVLAGATPERTRRFRPGGLLAVLLTGGLDLAVLALAAVAVLQLHRSTRADAPAEDLDVLLALSPTLVLVGTSLLALRLLPWVARVAERSTPRARGLLPAWAAWQTSRRMAEQAGTVLLVTLCTSLLVLATCLSATLDRLAHDKADFTVGAAARVDVVSAKGPGPVLAALPAAHALARGGGLAAVSREAVEVSAVSTPVTLLAAEARELRGIVRYREDLRGGHDVDALLAELPRTAGLPALTTVPPSARTVSLTGVYRGEPGPLRDIHLVLRAPSGEMRVVPMGGAVSPVPRADGTHAVTGSVLLAEDLPGRTGPLDLLALVLPVPEGSGAQISLSSLALDGTAVRDLPSWKTARSVLVLARPTPAPEPVPAVLSETAARVYQAQVGAVLPVRLGSAEITVLVRAVVPQLPTVTGGGLLVDRATLGDHRWRRYLADPRGQLFEPQEVPEELWLRDAATAGPVSAAFDRRTVTTRVVTAQQATDDRMGQPPFRSALTGTWLVAGSALALGIVSVVATTFVVGRRRRGELAVLGAMGVGRRTLRWTLVAERVALMALTTVVAAGLGLGAAAVIAPWLAMNAQVDDVPLTARLVLPWPLLSAMVGGVLLTLAGIAGATVRSLPRGLVAATLRMGER